MQVHKENIDRVPNAIKGRDSIDIEIYGMENIPERDLIEHERQKAAGGGASSAYNDDSDTDSESDLPSNSQSIIPVQPPPPPLPPPLPPTTTQQQQQAASIPIPPVMPPLVNPMLMNPYQNVINMPGLMNPFLQQQILFQQQHLQQTPPNSFMPSSKLNESTPRPLLPPGMVPPPHSFLPTTSQFYPPAHLLPFNPYMPVTGSNTVRKIENIPPGCTLVHPDEDLSLEELRAQSVKYKSQK